MGLVNQSNAFKNAKSLMACQFMDKCFCWKVSSKIA